MVSATQMADMETLTIKQVSQLLQVSEKTIRNRVRDGSFPKPRKFGRNVRWRTDVVRAWMTKGEAESAQ